MLGVLYLIKLMTSDKKVSLNAKVNA